MTEPSTVVLEETNGETRRVNETTKVRTTPHFVDITVSLFPHKFSDLLWMGAVLGIGMMVGIGATVAVAQLLERLLK